MKKTILIVMGLLVNSLLFSQVDTNFNTTEKRQKALKPTTVELEINVLADNKSINDSIQISLIYNGYEQTISGPNRFVLYLRYEIDYYIQISSKGYTAKLIRVNTKGAVKADWQLTANVLLNKSTSAICYVGGFAYENDTFKKIH